MKSKSFNKESNMKRVFFLTLLAATVVAAQPRWRERPEPHHGMKGEAIVKRLDLKEDQEKQFHKLHADLAKSQIAAHAKIQTLRIDLRELFGNDAPEKAAIESKISEISKIHNDIKLSHIAFWFDVNKTLTAEQKQIWKNHPMMNKRGMGHFPMRGMRRGMRMMGEDDEPEEMD